MIKNSKLEITKQVTTMKTNETKIKISIIKKSSSSALRKIDDRKCTEIVNYNNKPNYDRLPINDNQLFKIKIR